MSTPPKTDLPLGTTSATARLHTTIRRICYILLFALVIEGAFTLPFTLIWYGWPTLSVQEICSGLQEVMYNDPTVQCQDPAPLSAPPFGSSGPNTHRTTAKDKWGIQPTPQYPRIEFRELIKIYRHNQQIMHPAK
ncbi:hypothetical protein [Actinomadura sp. NTSP31]|uniref:hypothetical protein n=1 Tax=Actinomadura sp. NTSP31 TaxID=1735447 RepID=UPI0035C0DD32